MTATYRMLTINWQSKEWIFEPADKVALCKFLGRVESMGRVDAPLWEQLQDGIRTRRPMIECRIGHWQLRAFVRY